jgi:hypothetical protein
MTDRSKNLAGSRRKTPAEVTPVTKLVRTHDLCLDGLHLWCPGVVEGRKRSQDCLCPCHQGQTANLRAAR